MLSFPVTQLEQHFTRSVERNRFSAVTDFSSQPVVFPGFSPCLFSGEGFWAVGWCELMAYAKTRVPQLLRILQVTEKGKTCYGK